VAQTSVAYRQAGLAKLFHDGPHDAGPREDHFRAVGLKADDGPTHLGAARAVELDLPVDLGTFEGRSPDNGWVVVGEAVPDRGDVCDRAAYAYQRVRHRVTVEAPEVQGDRRHRLA